MRRRLLSARLGPARPLYDGFLGEECAEGGPSGRPGGSQCAIILDPG